MNTDASAHTATAAGAASSAAAKSAADSGLNVAPSSKYAAGAPASTAAATPDATHAAARHVLPVAPDEPDVYGYAASEHRPPADATYAYAAYRLPPLQPLLAAEQSTSCCSDRPVQPVPDDAAAPGSAGGLVPMKAALSSAPVAANAQQLRGAEGRRAGQGAGRRRPRCQSSRRRLRR